MAVEPRRAGDAWTVTVDTAAAADLLTVDALARLQLAVARGGGRIRVHGASPDLCRLLDLAGLAGVVECCDSDERRSD
jgi:hypothetical protein